MLKEQPTTKQLRRTCNIRNEMNDLTTRPRLWEKSNPAFNVYLRRKAFRSK